MRPNLMHRAINNLEDTRKKAEVILKDGRVLIGKGDCISWMPSDEDEDADEEVLKFDLEDGPPAFIKEDEVKSYRYL